MAYHITAAKVIKQCSCTACRAKYGRFNSLEEAEAALVHLTGQPILPMEPKNDELDFTRIQIPKTIDEDILAAQIEEAAANERFEEQVDVLVHDDEDSSDEDEQSSEAVKSADSILDDAEFLRGDDEVLVVKPDAALFQQMENVVSWRIDNFYDDDEKPRSKYALRSNPPVFIVEASDGSSAEFLLTKNLTLSMAEALETVKRGYYGVGPRRSSLLNDEADASKKDQLANWVKMNPSKTVLFALLFVLCVVTAFTQ